MDGPKDEEEPSAKQPSSLDYTKLSQNLSVFNSASNEAHDDDDNDNHLSATERMLKLENASREELISWSNFMKFDQIYNLISIDFQINQTNPLQKSDGGGKE